MVDCWMGRKESNQTNKHNSQIVPAKENLKLSHDGPSQRHASGTKHKQPNKTLSQGHHWVWGMI